MPRRQTPSSFRLIVAGFWLAYLIHARLEYGALGMFEIMMGLLAILVIILEIPLILKKYEM